MGFSSSIAPKSFDIMSKTSKVANGRGSANLSTNATVMVAAISGSGLITGVHVGSSGDTGTTPTIEFTVDGVTLAQQTVTSRRGLMGSQQATQSSSLLYYGFVSASQIRFNSSFAVIVRNGGTAGNVQSNATITYLAD